MRRHVMTDEEIDAKCIALSKRTALEQLENGTASSQIVTYFLKLGSAREQAELDLLRAKSENLDKGSDLMDVVKNAEQAFKGYQGDPIEGNDD